MKRDYEKKYKKISKRMEKLKIKMERLNAHKHFYKNLIDVDELIKSKKEK